MLKNWWADRTMGWTDQIIPINGMLKNTSTNEQSDKSDQIIPINGMLKNFGSVSTQLM